MKKRDFTLDVCRTFAIICVVLCHSSEFIYTYRLNEWNSLSFMSKCFSTIIFVIGRLGVPFFIFLTGSLILKKNIEKDEDIIKFYKHNLIPIIIVNSLWIVIYNLYLIIAKVPGAVSLDLFIKELFLIKTVPLYLGHTWYMPMIISMYLILPLIAKIIKSFSKKTISIVLIISFISYFIIPFINLILLIFKINYQIETSSYFKFYESLYLIYAIYGYYLYASKEENKNKYLYLLMFIVFLFSTIIIQFISYNYGHIESKVWYNSPLLFFSSYFLFKYVLSLNIKLKSKTIINIITFISRISFFIFFVHMLLLQIMIKYINKISINNSFKVIIMFVCSFTISILIGLLLNKNKFIKEKVMLV